MPRSPRRGRSGTRPAAPMAMSPMRATELQPMPGVHDGPPNVHGPPPRAEFHLLLAGPPPHALPHPCRRHGRPSARVEPALLAYLKARVDQPRSSRCDMRSALEAAPASHQLHMAGTAQPWDRLQCRSRAELAEAMRLPSPERDSRWPLGLASASADLSLCTAWRPVEASAGARLS